MTKSYDFITCKFFKGALIVILVTNVAVSAAAYGQKLVLIRYPIIDHPLYLQKEAFLEKFTRITKCAE